MSYLERLKELETHQRPTDRTDKSNSVGFVSSLPARIERGRFDREAFEKQAAVRGIDDGSSRRTAELTALVNLVADHHGFTTEQQQEALEIALADSTAALECFRGLAAGISTPRP